MKKDKDKDEEYYHLLESDAKGLLNIVLRDGPLSALNGCVIGENEIEEICRFCYNRLGYMLDLLFSHDSEKFQALCSMNEFNLPYPEPLNILGSDILDLEENYDLYKKMKKRQG